MAPDRIEAITARCELVRGDGSTTCIACGDGLPSRRRRFCSDQCGRAFSDQHRFEEARLLALERDGFRCVRCAGEDVQVHHRVRLPDRTWYRKRSCAHHVAALETLCVGCHAGEHRFAREVERLVEFADGVKGVQLALPLRESAAA